MTHTIREKQKLLARESEVGCEQVMRLLAAARGAMAGLRR
jgi:hypothetical protein